MLAGHERGDIVHRQVVYQGRIGLGIIALIVDEGEVRELPNELLDPVPVGGGPPPALDVGLPVPIPPDIVRQWSAGANIFLNSEIRDGKPVVRVTAVGYLVDQEEEQQ